jgi:hypothetical protein
LIYDPTTNVRFGNSLEEIIADPQLFFGTANIDLVDDRKWREKRLWSMCNDKLYGSVRRIEYHFVKSDPSHFEYEDQSRVVDFSSVQRSSPASI